MARARKAPAASSRRRTTGVGPRLERAIAEGHRAFDAKDPGLARLHFTHAIGDIRKSGKRLELLPELIGMIGRCLQRQQRWDEALGQYHQAAREAKRQHLPAQQLRWAGKHAITHLDMNNPATGLPLLELSIAMGRRLHKMKTPGVIDELASQLTRLAHESARDRDRASDLWREAFELLDQSDDPGSRFRAAFNYAGHLEEADRPRQAATYLEEALEIAERAKLDRARVAEALPLLSRVYRSMNAFERGGDTLLAELPHVDDSEVRRNLMKAAVNAYFDGSLWEKMKGVAGDLWRLLAQDGDRRAADMGARYAIACRETGDLDEAATVLEAAARLAADAGDGEMQQKARAELARVVFEQGRHERAARLYDELWAEGLRDPLIAVRYPEALLAVGRIADAKAACAHYVESGGDETEVAIPVARIADAEGVAAIDLWQTAAKQSRGRARALALERLLDLLPASDPERLTVAEALARIAENVREHVSDLFSEHAWRAASPLAGRFNRYLEIFLREAIAAGRHEDAVYELERFRSQLLVDVLSERGNAWAGERRTFEEKSGFADRAHRAQYRYEALAAMGAGWAERREAAVAADEARASALTAGRVILMGRQIFGMQFPEDLAEHLKDTALAPGERLVFLRITPGGTEIWYRGADGRLAHEPVPDFTLEVAQRLDTVLRQDPDIAPALGELDVKLASRLAGSLKASGATRAFLVGGTDIANLPLDHCDSLIGSGVETGFLPTARALGFARAPRFPTSDRLYIPGARERRRFAREFIAARAPRAMIVIDPTRSLRYAELEGIAVAAAAAPHLDVDIVERANASRTKVQAAVGGVGHLHLIGHGRFDGSNPYRTGMYLDESQSAGSLWTVADVFGEVVAPAGRLAVLSGCETGVLRGNVVSEEISLPAAFVAGGFAAVVASRWAVDDLSAALFATAFYRAWLPGKTTVAAALRTAAQWLRTLSKADAAEHLEGMEAAAREVDQKLGRRMARLARAARSDVSKRRARPFGDPRHWAAFYVVGNAAQVRRTT